MDFVKSLRECGLKSTPQRIAILESIQEIGHATIEEVYKEVSKTCSSVSLATIYKNIVSLCEKNILREVNVNAQKTRYEIYVKDHIHCVCIECGKLKDVDFNIAKVESEIPLIKSKIDFAVSSVCLIFYGKCRLCTQKQNKEQDYEREKN